MNIKAEWEGNELMETWSTKMWLAAFLIWLTWGLVIGYLIWGK